MNNCDFKYYDDAGRLNKCSRNNPFWINIFVDENNFLDNPSGPALESNNGYKWYYQHGKPHCSNQAAIIHPAGLHSYYYLGKKYENKESWFKALTIEERREVVWSLDE